MAKVLRGVILNPQADRSVALFNDGVLATGDDRRLTFVGHWKDFASIHGANVPYEQATGLILPAMVDLHTHVPQFPIRGDFSKGVSQNDPRGVLLASLQTNVFPVEAQFADVEHAERVIRAFVADAASHGVIGGCAFLTAHPAAARRAMEVLPPTWHGGLVLMNQNCPDDLCTPDAIIDDVKALSRDFGQRHVITDRFAVATTSPLRRRAAEVARNEGAMTQTHLNEQLAEKALVEDVLYRGTKSYADVYL
ncbi:MAG TPA: amidohydrolase family protein, partial [Tepidisphaeraceae bacterium]